MPVFAFSPANRFFWIAASFLLSLFLLPSSSAWAQASDNSTYDIVYISDETGHREIWTANSADSTDRRQVSQFAGALNPNWPRWSPNGKWITFDAAINSKSQIFAIRSDGSEAEKQLTNISGADYADKADFGSDPDWLYYMRVRPAQAVADIYRVNVETGAEDPDPVSQNRHIHSFDVSDDGDLRLEMLENGCCWTPNQYTMLHEMQDDEDTGLSWQVIARDGHSEWHGRISPDNQKIVYMQATGAYAPHGLYEINADGTGRRTLIPATSSNRFFPAWDPEGERLMIEKQVNGSYDLYILDLDNLEQQVFLGGSINYMQPDWLPLQGPDAIDHGLIVHFPLDVDGSDNVGGYLADPNGNVEYVEDESRQAVKLDGNSYLRVAGFDLTVDDFSVAMWLKADSLPSWYRVPFAIHSGEAGYNGLGDRNIMVYNSNTSGTESKLSGWAVTTNAYNHTSVDQYPSAEGIEAGTWHHVAYTQEGASRKLYIDGVEEGTGTNAVGTFSITGGLLEIGAPNFWGGGDGWSSNGRGDAKWRGMIDDIRVYDRALSADEVIEIALGPPYVPPPGPREIVGNIDPTRPTLVLTHGLQDDPPEGGVDPDALWNGFGDGTDGSQIGAGHILRGAGNFSELVNVVQVVWPEAFQGIGPGSYNNALAYADDVGTILAQYLLEVLGPTYNQPIQFVGHSLGSVANAYAAKRFLGASTNVTTSQVTILDYPNRAAVWATNIPETFFATLLQGIQEQRGLRIDNYYSNSLSPSAFGNPIVGVAYNHPALQGPDDVGSEVLDEGGTDHSGVHMWYRWTMDPNGINGAPYCDNDGSFNDPSIFFSPSLNPCERGWYWSLFGGGGPVFGTDQFPTGDLGEPITITEAALELDNPRTFGCAIDGNVVTCEEQSSPFIVFDVEVPADAEYIAFEYAFLNRGDGDYVAVLLEDKPIWVLGGDSALKEGEFMDTGPILVGELTGSRRLTVALYGVNESNAVFEAQNFRTSRGDVANAPPVANAGTDQVRGCASTSGAYVALDSTGSHDPEGDTLTYTWEGPFGTLVGEVVAVALPVGVHLITLTVDDGKGGADSDTVQVTVEDTTPPSLQVSLSPDMLWPPNHKMRDIEALVTVDDTCDANPRVVLTSLESNEPDNGKGDGNTVNDIQEADTGTDDRRFRLRAERSGKGDGRVYTTTYTATDSAGNATSASATVTVPHEKGKRHHEKGKKHHERGKGHHEKGKRM